MGLSLGICLLQNSPNIQNIQVIRGLHVRRNEITDDLSNRSVPSINHYDYSPYGCRKRKRCGDLKGVFKIGSTSVLPSVVREEFAVVRCSSNEASL
ncbi:hypothetical protein TNCV_536621 [Trichonephila clavipes]|nr:hypothetical protein TNCV_536621 [Trichonephila clavipes]